MSAPEKIAYRQPPHDLDAEHAVLGSVLLEGRETLPRVVEALTDTDFFTEAHRTIYKAMLGLFERGQPIDMITLSEDLRLTEALEFVGGPGKLALLVEQASMAANLDSYLRIVREHALRREVIQTCSRGVERAFRATDDAQGMVDLVQSEILGLTERRLEGKAVFLRGLLGETFATLQARAEHPDYVTGLPTGLIEVDQITAGLQPSDLILIAGRPSSGKTAFALGIAGHVGVAAQKPVLILSLEMTSQQLVQRLLAAEGRVDSHALRTGHLGGEDWRRLTAAAGRLSEAPILIDDQPSLTLLDVRAKARRVLAEHGLALLIIDYLQLMRGYGHGDNRQQEIAEISRGLKALAKELNIPVVALSQLSRAIETRSGDPAPRLSDLRESGSLEQDSDVVLFLYRPRSQTKEPDRHPNQVVEVHVGKQRNGPTGILEVSYLAAYTRFENLTRRNESFI